MNFAENFSENLTEMANLLGKEKLTNTVYL